MSLPGAKLLQSCLTLYDPMYCSLPGSSVHGIFQARILEWFAMPSSRGSSFFLNFFIIKKNYYFFFHFTILYWFCHTSTCIRHGCTRVSHPEPLSHLPPHTIPLGHSSAPAPSFLYPASNLDWRFVSYIILYMF